MEKKEKLVDNFVNIINNLNLPQKAYSKLKYFIPNIEDIRVNYECEWLLNHEWKKAIYTVKDFEGLPIDIDGGWIRTPYLTKEQIEAEGWEVYEKDSQKRYDTGLIWGSMGFTKNNYVLRWNFADNSISIILLYPSRIEGLYFNSSPEHFKCTCSCKDINEFRYITNNLLNIE